MDLMSLLRYLFDHNQQVIGGLVVIILATAALLMMRMVSQEKTADAHAANDAAPDLDLGAIESAFKRVLATTQVSVGSAASGATPAEAVPASEQETKIQELAREVDRLTAELNTKSAEPVGFGGTAVTPAAAGDAGAVEALQAKIAELEGKLTEYEIIEDDIADLSRFKEENAELRGELEALKANAGSRAAAPAAAPAAAAPAPAPVVTEDPVAAAEALMAATTPTEAPAAAAEVTETSALSSAVADLLSFDEPAAAEAEDPLLAALESEASDLSKKASAEPEASAEPASNLAPDEIAMKEKGESLEIEIGHSAKNEPSSDLVAAAAAASLADGSSPLDDSVDTEKMLSEVANLSTSEQTDEAALEGSLDTDKLLAEVGSMAPGKASSPEATPAVSAPAPAAPTPAAAAPTVAPAAASPAVSPTLPNEISEDAFEDDLLAEFKDSNDGGQG